MPETALWCHHWANEGRGEERERSRERERETPIRLKQEAGGRMPSQKWQRLSWKRQVRCAGRTVLPCNGPKGRRRKRGGGKTRRRGRRGGGGEHWWVRLTAALIHTFLSSFLHHLLLLCGSQLAPVPEIWGVFVRDHQRECVWGLCVFSCGRRTQCSGRECVYELWICIRSRGTLISVVFSRKHISGVLSPLLS